MTGYRFENAASRFRDFFGELGEVFVERQEVIQQMALALLGRQHLLMTGPPGTAKSELTKAVLSRIIDAQTGEPSLFERQFSESTVLTDLVGAIDFKTLTETGRTEHFTDEGLIGSVHAFLDEVLDGRDMLLRSTLNLLGEREFKQGKKTVRGHVECAFMTTNRYLAEVLDESRESLLAFIDRIAYVSFIPQGFAATDSLQRVLRAQVGGQRRKLAAVLTIQDLDVLQEVTENVPMAPELCDRLAGLFVQFADETAAAVRADPEYVPSRYLSTRTKVRAGAALRAIAVHDKIVANPRRPLEVLPRDFAGLRLLLSLAGPSGDDLTGQIDQQDPREARQMRIVRTERDIFRRCLARVDHTPVRVAAETPAVYDEAALRRLSTKELLEAVDSCQAAPGVDRDLLRKIERLAAQRIAQMGLGAPHAEHSRTTIEQMGALLRRVEHSRGFSASFVAWLQQQLLRQLDATVAREILPRDWSELDRRLRAVDVGIQAEEKLDQIEALAEQRAYLIEVGVRPAHDFWERSLDAFQVGIVGQFRRALNQAISDVLDQNAGNLEVLLTRLVGAIEPVQRVEMRLDRVLATPSRLQERVVEAHVPAIVACATQGLVGLERVALLGAVDNLLALLARFQCVDQISAPELLETVLRQAADAEAEGQLTIAAPIDPSPDPLVAYRARRAEVPRCPLSYLAAQLCLVVDPDVVVAFEASPDLAVLAQRVARLSEPLRVRIVAYDLRRIERAIDYVSTWWQGVVAREDNAARVAAAVQGGLYATLQNECALTRFQLEAELLAQLLPEAQAPVQQLVARLRSLEQDLLIVHRWVAEQG